MQCFTFGYFKPDPNDELKPGRQYGVETRGSDTYCGVHSHDEYFRAIGFWPVIDAVQEKHQRARGQHLVETFNFLWRDVEGNLVIIIDDYEKEV